jgi:hypothetical protein
VVVGAGAWAVWYGERVWFSCGARSRKARNLGDDPHCTVATDDAANPVGDRSRDTVDVAVHGPRTEEVRPINTMTGRGSLPRMA